MKHTLLLFALILMAPALAVAQPSWTKKAAKSVFTLKTFATDGTLIASSYGVFTGTEGQAVSSYQPFKGAASAVVIDMGGKEYPVTFILGANETYDVVRFQVDAKKTQPLTVATAASAQDATVYLLPYREQKQPRQGTIRKAETFNGDYAYYTLALAMPQDGAGLPLVDSQGQLIALMQPWSAAGADTLCYAVSARFADSLKINGLSINDAALRAIGIKKALPDDPSQALLTLFVASSTTDSLAYAQMVDDFIVKFPDEQDGYITRAQLHAAASQYEQADADMAQAVKVGTKKDEAHYSYSRLIYQKALYQTAYDYPAWTLERALDEAKAAYSVNPLPLYLQQQAYVLYAQKEYAQASALYNQLTTSDLRSPELFVEAAQCRLVQGDSVGRLALLDSAVALFSRPYLREAAPFLQMRAQARMEAARYRDAVTDLNDYEQLMAQQVNDNFYSLRFQAETEGRLFQQALNDIAKAIQMNPQNEVYYAEKASLEVRVGLYDEAIATATECTRLVPEFSDGYLFLGLAQCLKGQKAEGVKNLLRAKELGDNQADALIERYGK